MPTAHTEASLAGGSSQTTPGSNARGLLGGLDLATRLQNLREGHRRKYEWSADLIQRIRDLNAAAMPVLTIAQTLGINVKTLRCRAPKLGIALGETGRERNAAADAVLLRRYRTNDDVADIHAEWIAARGDDASQTAMRARAVRLGLARDGGVPHAQLVRANRARAAQAAERRAEKIEAAREAVAKGMSRGEVVRAAHVSPGTLREWVRDGLVVFPPPAPKPVVVKPPRPVVVKAPKPPKPAKVRPVAPRAEPKPAPAPVRFQTVEEFLAAGGKITRCPTVALLATQATVPASDTEAVRAYYDAKPTGNWRAQRVAEWKKAKREEATRAGR